MQELIAITQLDVEHQCRDEAEPSKQQRRDPRLKADDNQEATTQLDSDSERQEFTRQTERPQICLARPIGGELGIGLVQEIAERRNGRRARRPLPEWQTT